MTFQTVCSAWLTDLTTNVTGLDSTTVPVANRHLYTPWAVEDGYASTGERHIAIWPEGEAEQVEPILAGTGPSHLANQQFVVRVWEDASLDSSRLQDNETAADAWLTLAQAIRARLYVWANIQLGSVDTTRYLSTAFDFRAEARIMEVRFLTQVVYSYA